MAEKLERKVMEIYGENAATRDIIAYGSDIAGNIVETKDPDVIQTEAYKTGVRSAVVGNNSTTLQNRQALDFLFSRQLKYLYQHGVAEWGASETYFVNSFVSGSNGNIYVSLTDNNKGNDPTTDTTNWQAFLTPAEVKDLIESYAAKKDLTNTNMITNCILSAPNGVFKIPNWKEFWVGTDVSKATDRNNVKLGINGAYPKDKVSLTDANGNWSYVAKFKITKPDSGNSVVAKGRILNFSFRNTDASQSAYAEIQFSDSSGSTKIKPFFARIRPKFGDTTTEYTIPSTQLPVEDAWNWIKLQKDGTVYTMFYSQNGNSWTSLGQVQAENFSGVPEETSGLFRITKPSTATLNMYADFSAEALNFFYNSQASTPLVTYDAYTLTVNNGLKVALANGYNADGTPKSEIVTLENDVSLTGETSDDTYMAFIFLCKLAEGSYKILNPAQSNFGVVSAIPSNITGYKVYLNTTDNKLYEYGSDFSNIYDRFVMLGYAQLTNGQFTQVFPYKPIQLSLAGLGDYVVESYNDAQGNWYRKYKSGWLEQGGLVASTSGATGTIQTLLKPFANANYTLTATARGTFDRTFLITSKTATTFSCAYSSSAVGAYDWRAIGQGAN